MKQLELALSNDTARKCLSIVEIMHKRQQQRERQTFFRKLYYKNPARWVKYTGIKHPELTFEENRAILSEAGKW